jgi:hypothetical protein
MAGVHARQSKERDRSPAAEVEIRRTRDALRRVRDQYEIS